MQLSFYWLILYYRLWIQFLGAFWPLQPKSLIFDPSFTLCHALLKVEYAGRFVRWSTIQWSCLQYLFLTVYNIVNLCLLLRVRWLILRWVSGMYQLRQAEKSDITEVFPWSLSMTSEVLAPAVYILSILQPESATRQFWKNSV